jgi:hypothetical protein
MIRGVDPSLFDVDQRVFRAGYLAGSRQFEIDDKRRARHRS